jgi:D-3-phosphoglycerate dehydrogenase
MKVLVTETLAPAGLAHLREHAEVEVRTGLKAAELCAIIGAYDALVVRSATDVNEALVCAAPNLKVIGRAGTGVDNIDVDIATDHGIIVVNAPTGNSNAVAEHTITMVLALARRLYPAVASLKQGRWDKRSLQGIEVKGRVLGLVGLGRVGAMVAEKARGLEMRVLAYDPYISPSRAANMGVELIELDHLLAQADFVSVHVPLTPKTHGLLDAGKLALLKPSAYVINCARGGIVDEAALKSALQAHRIAGAALDVFEVEPVVDAELVGLDNVLATPHVGASTEEAQEQVALDVARSVVDALEGRLPASPVNVPYLAPQAAEFLRPYIDLAHRLGSLFVQWRGELNDRIELSYEGEICDHDTRILTSSFLAGLLAPISAEPVNVVNARKMAERRGLAVSETTLGRREHYGSLITARTPSVYEAMDVAGAIIQGEPYVVSIDSQPLSFEAQGHVLIDLHADQPGIVGALGQLLGDQGINISFAQLSRAKRGGMSLMALGLDEEAPHSIVSAVLTIPNIRRVRAISLPPFESR